MEELELGKISDPKYIAKLFTLMEEKGSSFTPLQLHPSALFCSFFDDDTSGSSLICHRKELIRNFKINPEIQSP
ncbi:hypothetical protein TNIN_471331 [Trichonephila inaurata madagascariensis]|uniref:Uncharacterized protein n=1 Tax=Trichonephila inaurata madagascariensis TaxID=2747483 RepID=A0A8X7CMU0_9ARAC|nr:hypothetical protein TNIN_471331 [Trichonephila inaurata madagascariensis]